MNRYPSEFQRFVRTVQKQLWQANNGGSGGRGRPNPSSSGVSGGLGGLLLLVGGSAFVNASFYNVDGGHRAVLYSRVTGVREQTIGEGTHFAIPWLETPVIYDVRSKPRNVSSLTGTNDLQMVNIACRVLFRPNVQMLPTLYRTLGQDYDERVLPSIVNEVLKAVTAQFNASQLITEREHVSRLIRDNLVRRAATFNILLDDVSITNMSFSPEFTAAVEAKQIAQQDAQRAMFVVDKAIQEKKGTVIRAQGEAKSAELIGEAIKKSKDYVELRKLETATEIAAILAQSPNRLILDNDTLLLNTLADSRDKK